MKFKNVTTGAILETNNEWTIEQMKSSDVYQEVKDTKAKEEQKDTKVKSK